MTAHLWSTRTSLAILATLALMSCWTTPSAYGFPHYTNFDRVDGWVYLTPGGATAIVVSGIAAESVSETGEAHGAAVFQYVEFGRPGRHLSIAAKFRAAEYAFDDDGNVLGLVLTGIAEVTDVSTQTSADALVQLVSNHDGVHVLLAGDGGELAFEASPPGEPIAVETPGRLTAAMIAAGIRIGSNGELDTMAAGVVGLSTGDVLGGTAIQQQSERETLSAETVVDRLRIRRGREGVAFDLRGTSLVVTSAGECVSKFQADFLMPVEDVFTISGNGTLQVPRCGVRAAMSTGDGAHLLGWATFPSE